jgi:hypothetical protein
MRINPAGPLYFNRFYTGWITQRNKLAIPIRVFGRRIIELYDALLAGSNMELNNFSTLQRRPGFLAFNSNTVPGIQQNYYSFQPAGTGQVFPLIDTTTGVYQLSSGAAAPTTLLTKSSPAQTTFKSVGTFCYCGSPAISAQKIDQNLNVTNMGIAIAAGADQAGPNACTTGSDPTAEWINPSNVTLNNPATPAEAFPDQLFGTSDLWCGSFGFSIPATTTITGIEVAVTGSSPTAAAQQVYVSLSADGATAIGSPRGGSSLPTSTGTLTFGGPSDTWGVPGSLNTLVNGAGFSVGVQVFNTSPTLGGQEYLTYVTVTVYGIGGPTVSPTGSGSLAAQNGWTYAYAYGNSASANLSNLSPVSENTGPFSGKDYVGVSVTASTDPQVNQIRVFRTTDGGPQNLMNELPNSPFANATAVIQDTATDAELQQTSIMTTTPLNSPPPTGISGFEWYGGRLWGFVGNILYFSSGPDIIQGNQPECWNPDYSFPLPTQIVKLVSLGASGMLVFTIDCVHIVQGNSTQSFTVNVYEASIGARSYNAVDFDGTNVWVFTSDRQALQITPSGVSEFGDNIGDQLDLLDPTLCYVRAHQSGSQDKNLFITNGSGTTYTYNLKQQAWCLPASWTFGAGAIGSVEIAAGVYKLLTGGTSAAALVAQRDLGTFSDLGTNYTCGATFGNIQFADPGMLAELESLVTELSSATSTPNVGVLVNDISGTFAPLANGGRQEPTQPSIPTPQASYKSLVWMLATGDKNKVPRALRHLQFQLSWAALAEKSEILGLGLLGPADTGGAPAGQPAIQGR